MRWLVALALVLAAALPAAAAPFVVRLGMERLVLDAPVGFSDSLGMSSPRLQELAESQTSASNRILLFAITDADLRRFMNGDPPDFRRYMMVAIPARLEHERISRSQFEMLASESLRDMGTPPTVADYYMKHLDVQARGQSHLLAELRREPEVMSALLGTRLPPPQGDPDRDKPQYLISTSTLLLMRGKALTVSVYAAYDGPADLDWIRALTLRWVDELRRLNRSP